MSVIYNNIFTDDFKSNYFTLNFLMPLNEKTSTGCALLAQVLKRGCQKYGEMDQITASLEKLYGADIQISSDKVGENISFTAQASFLDNSFALNGEDICGQALDILAELLLRPFVEDDAFPSRYFLQEKQNLADYIKSQMNDKRVYSVLRCKEIMFSDRPYRFGSNGTLECLESMTAQSLYAFYRDMLAGSGIMVTYIGRKIDVEKTFEHFFGSISHDAQTSLCPVRLADAGDVKSKTETFDVVQGKLCLGYRFADTVDLYAARLFNVIFGGSPTSKLFLNVREKLSLCYYCSSGYDPFVQSLFVSSGIEFKNVELAKEEIFRQLEDIQNGKMTHEEFENGKLYLLDYVKGIKDSPGQLVADAVRGHLLGVTDDIDLQIQKIEALSPDDIVAAASKVTLDTVYFLRGKEETR